MNSWINEWMKVCMNTHAYSHTSVIQWQTSFHTGKVAAYIEELILRLWCIHAYTRSEHLDICMLGRMYGRKKTEFLVHGWKPEYRMERQKDRWMYGCMNRKIDEGIDGSIEWWSDGSIEWWSDGVMEWRMYGCMNGKIDDKGIDRLLEWWIARMMDC